MRLTFVGHASWLVSAGRTRLLTDPTLLPTFTGGTWEVSPSRRVAWGRLPELSGIFVSHSHRDHFDLATLARLPNTLRVFCPEDDDILYALGHLGFRDVLPVSPWSYHRLGDLEIVFTPSNVRFPEVGLLVSDLETTFWNQVDTDVSSATIERVNKTVGAVDFVAHNYQPMLELDALEAQRTDFPYERYRSVLQRVRLLAPRALCPASSGERLVGDAAWFNAYRFPVSRERFARDVQWLLPGVRTLVPDPGDVVDVRAAGARLSRQVSPFVRTTRRDASSSTAFAPGAFMPRIVDTNPRGVSPRKLRRVVRWFFTSHVPALLRRANLTAGAVRTLGAKLAFHLVYPAGDVERWLLDVSRPRPRARIRPKDAADYTLTVAASSLHDLVTGETRLDAIAQSGRYRAWSAAYRVGPDGLSSARELCPPELHGDPPVSMIRFLGKLLVPDDAAARRRLVVEIELAKQSQSAPPRTLPFWLDAPPKGWGAGP